jgi:hypothetical protein
MALHSIIAGDLVTLGPSRLRFALEQAARKRDQAARIDDRLARRRHGLKAERFRARHIPDGIRADL